VLWAFTDTYALALNLNATERHPTPTELFADGPHLAVRRFEIGDPSLSREKARSLDVGLRRAAGAWSFAVSAFLNDYDDYVYPLFTGEEEDGLPVVQYVQEDAEFTGIEAEVTLPSVSLGAARLETRLVADYVRAELDDGGDLPQIPPLRLGAEFGVVVDRLRVGLSTHWYDDQDRVSAEELPTPGYTMIDVDVSYRVPVADRTLLVFLRGGNLLDEDARRHTSPLKDFAPLPGRSIGAGFRFDF
jgi:iron complex outermembrane receptor protein